MGRHNKARKEYLKIKVKDLLDQGKPSRFIRERFDLTDSQYRAIVDSIGKQKENIWGLSKVYQDLQGRRKE